MKGGYIRPLVSLSVNSGATINDLYLGVIHAKLTL